MNKPLTLFCAAIAVKFFLTAGSLGVQLASLQHESDIQWRTVTTEHFWIHFPSEYQELGNQVATLCEDVYDPISRSLNYYPGRTHVIVHTRTDFPDGAVSFLPWRMELHVTEPQGNSLGSGDSWLRILIAHEFTHIVHLRKRKGISSLTYPFLGDYNAFWQQIVPLWFTEGFATLNETRFTSGGRGRTPVHWMQMAAPIQTGEPWHLENTNYHSRKRMPPTWMRYISGYYLSYFFDKRFGADIWRKILDRYTALPFLGLGRTVKSVTGQNLETLYGAMLKEFAASSPEQKPFVRSIRMWRKPEIPEDQHSPRWLDNDHLLIYRKSFDDLPELTLIDRTGRLHLITQRTLSKQDNGFTVGTGVIVWAELHPHPRFSATVYSDLFLHEMNAGKTSSLTHNARVYNPDLSPDETEVAAIQTFLPAARLVTVNLRRGDVTTLLEIPGATLLNPRWSPDGRRIAFALKDSAGKQNIAVVETQSGRWRYLYPPNRHHDNNPCWTPDGRFILYSSDQSGVFNTWAVQVTNGRRWMVTDADLGAFTPDVSPDGRELAFANYTSRGLVAATVVLDSTLWLPASAVQPYDSRFTFKSTGVISAAHPASTPPRLSEPSLYQPWSQILRPQGWVPFIGTDETGTDIRVMTTSQDALHRHIWRGVVGVSPKKPGPSVNFLYSYRRWWPEFTLQAYSLPQPVSSEEETGWWLRRGLSLQASVPLVLERNVYTTSFKPLFKIIHESRRRSTGLLRPKLQKYRGVQFGLHWARSAYALRDVVPHRAWFASAFADWTDSVLGSEFNGNQLRVNSGIYLPTFLPHHQVEISARYQHRQGDYDYGFYGALPMGYADDHRKRQFRLRLAYILPLAFLEFPLPVLPVFVDYLDAALFYDRGQNRMYSAGLQVTAVTFFFHRFRVRLGVAVYYHSQKKSWKQLPVIELPFQ